MEQVINLMEGRSISQPMRYICAILLALIIGLLISYMIVWQTRKKTQSTPIPKKAELTTGAVAITAAGMDVYRRVTRSSGSGSSSSGGGFSGGGGGGGGGGGFYLSSLFAGFEFRFKVKDYRAMSDDDLGEADDGL
jgi:uncharacterized membrane protein YgcG